MDKRTETVLGIMLVVGLVSHYFIGYFLWDKLGSEKVYSITAYFCMDIWGFAVYLLAQRRFLKGVGGLGMLLGSYYFYMEFNDPSVWVYRDYLTLILIFLNCFFIWYFTDIFKSKKS